MRLIPVPAAAVWPGAQRHVMGAPNGDLTDDTIRPVEVIVDVSPSVGVPCYTVLAALDPGDLDRIQAGAAVAVTLYAQMVPVSVDLLDLPGARPPAVGTAWAETTRARMDAWAATDHIPPGRYRVHAVVDVDSTGVPHPAGIEHGMHLRGLLGPLGPVLLEPTDA